MSIDEEREEQKVSVVLCSGREEKVLGSGKKDRMQEAMKEGRYSGGF